MNAAHLEKLNDRQRAAVEHGIGLPDGKAGGPLLIIAGAGSGKTNTLAHRVAHLIVYGSDPRRILLMTFSRRAASEMARRVERICRGVLGDKAGVMTDALAWAGTFHGIGARILRDYADQIGLDPQFTIHDRERHEPIDRSRVASVEALCRDAHQDHDWRAGTGPRGLSNRKLEDTIERWLELPTRLPADILPANVEWETGPWLSSWETSLPPDRPRYFQHDGFTGRIWLYSGEEPSEDVDEDIPTYGEYDNVAEIAKNLVACWPNPPKEIAAAAAITLRQLQWFISERSTLDRSARFDLEHLLGIEYDERIGRYTPAGSYVLIARKARAIEAIYQEISGGGDACPCELVPAQGQADPSWRYVLIAHFANSGQ